MTLRAIDILRRADLVACEDTRVSGKLMQHFQAPPPLVPYHDHNAERMRPVLLARVEAGEAVALISDAGTPLVSDPGFKLVRAAIEAGHAVHTAPGASAVLAALVLSGLPTDRFFFAGFLASKSGPRAADLAALAGIPSTLVFFESGPRLAASLAAMARHLGDRPAAVARELTKLHEAVRRGSLSALARAYAEAGAPKGEIAIVVGPPAEAALAGADELDAALRAALVQSGVRDAASTVATSLGLPKRQVYARALALVAARARAEAMHPEPLSGYG